MTNETETIWSRTTDDGDYTIYQTDSGKYRAVGTRLGVAFTTGYFVRLHECRQKADMLLKGV